MGLKVAFIYNKNDKGLTGNWYCNNSYRFFREGLFENTRIETTGVPFERELDCSILKDFDVLLFYNIVGGIYFNVDKVKALKIARAPDCHNINETWINVCKRFGIGFTFNHQPEIYARKFLPGDIAYYQIIFGINKEICTVKPYSPRKKDKILLSGIIYASEFYVLRELCYQLNFTDYFGRNDGFIVDNYSELLGKYRAAIAASTLYSVYKYFEIPANGCLSFMEVNAENGCGQLGFVDGHHAIFINQDNYIESMNKFIENPDDPNWKAIANNGRDFVLRTYENKIQVNKLIDIIEKVI